MKAKQFLKKYALETNRKFDRDEFCDDMLQELWSMFQNTSKGLHPVARWEKILKDLRMKWDSVFNKSILTYKDGEKFWNYFFATRIIPVRDEIFGDWKQAKHDYRYKTDPDFRRRYNTWKMHQQFEQQEKAWYQDMFNARIDFFKNLLFGVEKHKANLGILHRKTITKEIVNSAYRSLSKTKHPDVGGDSNEFIKIKKARDTLLKYLEAV